MPASCCQPIFLMANEVHHPKWIRHKAQKHSVSVSSLVYFLSLTLPTQLPRWLSIQGSLNQMYLFYINTHITEQIISSAFTACGSSLALLQAQAGRHLIISGEMAGYPCARAHVVLALEHGRALSKLQKCEILDFCFTRAVFTQGQTVVFKKFRFWSKGFGLNVTALIT